MHSNESAPPSTGPALLNQLGRLIVRARSTSPTHQRRRHKLISVPSTSQQVQIQPKPESQEPLPGVVAQLGNHVHALWNEHIPICIEILLAPDCADCYAALRRVEAEAAYDKAHAQQRALLLERWTMRVAASKSHEALPAITAHWLLNAVRSQLHFSQLSAWRATIRNSTDDKPAERRRKLSRETCNYKKIEANCDQESERERKLNLIYSIKIPGESYKTAEFSRPPNGHKFPVTDIGGGARLQVLLESLPRLEDIPTVKCTCPKRRTSKEMNIHDELAGKLNDLTLGPRTKFDPITSMSRRHPLSAGTDFDYLEERKIVDDRMLTPCSESGKHKCSCDDESDTSHTSSSSPQEPKLDERKLKEIAKYKRRLRKESKLNKLCDSTSSEGDSKRETHTSIPILQAARFDRFRAIGCFRNQTYLTLPASRLEGRTPFADTLSIQPAEFRRTNTVGTQTDDVCCACGDALQTKCDRCQDRGMVRSNGTYNLAALENGARRKREEDDVALKKHKCDSSQCDIDNSSYKSDILKRPKLRRYFPITDRITKVINDRTAQNNDIQELKLRDDDTVFLPKPEAKRQKTFSIGDDYVCYEKCDYGTVDEYDVGSPQTLEDFNTPLTGEEFNSPQKLEEFQFPDPKKGGDNQVPTPTEVDRFRWRFDSAASMVFHNKTGLPLTSSPAPLRRGNNCFDFDDSINGVSGIKSALFHPAPVAPPSPAPPRAPPRARPLHGPSTALLGSFEESALKGRLEPAATVHGFTAELGASGAFCPPHRRLPVTVFFYAPGGTNAPYMGHINLGAGGYRVARSGTVQVSLFNPHGTLVKMFVVLYDLTSMPPRARTFLRQRTLYMPAAAPAPPPRHHHRWLRYLIHLRFMTSKSGKLYLHTDIRIIVSRKADLDTATAHSALFRPVAPAADDEHPSGRPTRPNRVFGGCGDFDSDLAEEGGGGSYELRSFTYAPENPKYSPR